MKQVISDLAKVIPFPGKRSLLSKELKELLKDEEVADFYRFVDENDLRKEALASLEKAIERLKTE